MRLVRVLIIPVFLYTLRIPWTLSRSNESILNELNTKKIFLVIVTEKITFYIGHFIRRDGLENLTIQGKVEG